MVILFFTVVFLAQDRDLLGFIRDNLDQPEAINRQLVNPFGDYNEGFLNWADSLRDESTPQPLKNMLVRFLFALQQGMRDIREVKDGEADIEQAIAFLDYGSAVMYHCKTKSKNGIFYHVRISRPDLYAIDWGNDQFKRSTPERGLFPQAHHLTSPAWTTNHAIGFKHGCGSSCSVVLVLPIHPTIPTRRYLNILIEDPKRNLIVTNESSYTDKGNKLQEVVVENFLSGEQQRFPLDGDCWSSFIDNCVQVDLKDLELSIRWRPEENGKLFINTYKLNPKLPEPPF